MDPTRSLCSAIRDLIEGDRPFFVARPGGVEFRVAAAIAERIGKLSPWDQRAVQLNAGVYVRSPTDIETFARMYASAFRSADLVAYVHGRSFADLMSIQDAVLRRYRIPFRSWGCLNGITSNPCDACGAERTWVRALEGKTVLVIFPFVDSAMAQLARGDEFLERLHGCRIFAPGQKFKFVGSFQTIANNRPHAWYGETLEAMKARVREAGEFDVALLACGAYGLPLGAFIKRELGRSAIYVGASLQLAFGIMGARWASEPIAAREGWVRPASHERPRGACMVERGCYW